MLYCYDHVIGVPVQDIFTHLMIWVSAEVAILIKYEIDYVESKYPESNNYLDIYEDDWILITDLSETELDLI